MYHTGANELNKTNSDALRLEAPKDWAQKAEDSKHQLPAGMNDSIFSSVLQSPLFKDLEEIEEVVKNSAINKPGVRGKFITKLFTFDFGLIASPIST